MGGKEAGRGDTFVVIAEKLYNPFLFLAHFQSVTAYTQQQLQAGVSPAGPFPFNPSAAAFNPGMTVAIQFYFIIFISGEMPIYCYLSGPMLIYNSSIYHFKL